MSENGGARTVLGRRTEPGAIVPGEFTYSVVVAEPAAWSGAERRGDKRQRTRLRDATIGERKHRIIADCRIRDRSRDGARLQLTSEAALPRCFVLTDGAARLLYSAMLVWQDGREAGVKLTPLE